MNRPAAWQYDMALTRIDHNTRSNSGQIAQVKFVIPNQLPNGDTIEQMPLTISGITAVDSIGNLIPLDNLGDTLTILDTTAGISNVTLAGSEITLFPNPAENVLNVTMSSARIYTLSVLSAEGKTVLSEKINGNTQLNVSQLAQGLYLLRFSDEAGNSVIKRFVKE